VVLWQLVEDDVEPADPIAVTCPASSEAIDALLGAKRGSPRIVPDETKLAIANCASRGSTRPKTFGAVQHRSLLLVLSSLFVDHPSFTVALDEPVHFPTHGDRAPIVISRVSYTPKAILIVRDLVRGKMRFRSRPFERRKS
jgi:hypothetical protein